MNLPMEYRIQTPEEVAERKARERAALLALPREEAARLVRWGLDGQSRDLGGMSLGLGRGITDDEDGRMDEQ